MCAASQLNSYPAHFVINILGQTFYAGFYSTTASQAAIQRHVTSHSIDVSMDNATPTTPKESVQSYKFPRKMDPDKFGFFDFPAEIRNIIYEHCAHQVVDIATSKSHPLLETHRATNIECIDWFYSENVFFLDACPDFTRWGASHLTSFQNWSSQIGPRHASMIRHLRIATPAFEAQIHIPRGNCTEPVTVTFEQQKIECLSELTVQIVHFLSHLKAFNSTHVGKTLNASDLNDLVEKVLFVVPFCCLEAAEEECFYARCWDKVERDRDICRKYLSWNLIPEEIRVPDVACAPGKKSSRVEKWWRRMRRNYRTSM